MLPISVVVPTRNSMSLLPKHFEAMRSWVDLAEEVVAVDSHSNDGTLEFLQRELKHPNVRVLTHPPGLYQSWNFGIARCRAKYTYVSTVGEEITRAGLTELHAVAERFTAEVVISPPRMVDMAGQPKEKEWPVHTLLEKIQVTEPVALEGLAAQLLAVIFVQRGILGSSASDLYRTEVLQRFPFRTDFGTAGDVAWGLEHLGRGRMAILPRSYSTFVFHPKSYAKSDYAVSNYSEKCIETAAQTVAARSWAKAGVVPAEGEALLHELLRAWREFVAAKRAVDASKAKGLLSFFRSGTWRARADREAESRRLLLVRVRALDFVQRSLMRAG